MLKTKVVKNKDHPVFNTTFQFEVRSLDTDNPEQYTYFQLKLADVVHRTFVLQVSWDDYIGEVN